MKKTFIQLTLFILVITFTACNNNWDNYFFGKNQSITEEADLDHTLTDFFASHPEFSDYYQKLKDYNLDKELVKNQQVTLWVVDNQTLATTPTYSNDTLRMKYHLNYLSFGLNDLKNNIRIRTISGIYTQIAINDQGTFVNDAQVIKSYRLKNGCVHIISKMLTPRLNMYDYLKGLGSDYSIIRDSIFKYDKKVFDKANSTPIGVDKTGNTIYDSIFYVYNPIFDKALFNSEFKQFTVFVPSNQVIQDCFSKLQDQYSKMAKTVTHNDSVVAFNWIKQAMFYDGQITDFTNKDIKSVYSKVWRTSVQKVDESKREELSNGYLYYVTDLKIPNYEVLSRIKSLVQYWQYQTYRYPDVPYHDNVDLSNIDCDMYSFNGLVGAPKAATVDATPKPAIMPNYVCLEVSGNPDDAVSEFSIEFSPLEYNTLTNTVKVLQVPTGEYNLYMGFQSSASPICNFYFNGTLVASNVDTSLSTPWNYDRVNETESERITGGTAKWDGLGGLVGTVKIDGDGLATFRIKVQYVKSNPAGTKRLRIYHWALKPTVNNY